jgi:hypothetical protein
MKNRNREKEAAILVGKQTASSLRISERERDTGVSDKKVREDEGKDRTIGDRPEKGLAISFGYWIGVGAAGGDGDGVGTLTLALALARGARADREVTRGVRTGDPLTVDRVEIPGPPLKVERVERPGPPETRTAGEVAETRRPLVASADEVAIAWGSVGALGGAFWLAPGPLGASGGGCARNSPNFLLRSFFSDRRFFAMVAGVDKPRWERMG